MQHTSREPFPANRDTRTEDENEKNRSMTATAIYDITDACFDALERLVCSIDTDFCLEPVIVSEYPTSNESPRDIRGLRNSFALWIDYTGALAPLGASLDDRLHDHDEIQGMVVDLLYMVEKNLECLERTSNQKAMFANAESQHWLLAIDSALDRLHFLASVIRQASAVRHDHNLLNFVSEEDESFRSMIISYVKYKYPSARSSLREHMADSITRRRRSLLLKHRHANRLKMRRLPKSSLAVNPEHFHSPSTEKATAKLTGPGGSPYFLHSVAGSRATQASKMDGRAALQHITQKPASSTRSSGSSQQGDPMSAEFLCPDPPGITSGAKHVQCPYCLQPLPAAEISKGIKNKQHRTWRRHVNQDLQPYVCLFQRCANFSFDHRSDWKKHMVTTHSKDWPREVHSMTWYCDLGHSEPFEFDNESHWRQHMRTLSLHPGRSKTPSDTQLEALTIRKQQLSPRDLYVCPFCEDKPRSIAILGDHGNPTDMADALVNHIAEHVKSLSFLSLPGLVGDATGDDKMSGKLDNASHKRLRNPGSPAYPPSGATFLDDVSLTFTDGDRELGLLIYEGIDFEYDTSELKLETDHLIPPTESGFSWDFIPPRNVALSVVDDAFKDWHDHASPPTPYFVVPPGFRTNTFFVGMEKQVKQLHKALFNSLRRARGTACVLYGPAGAGKTHVARQFVTQYRSEFKGGVFWINAWAKEGIDAAYLQIWKDVSRLYTDSPIDRVKGWFESREEWLLVFDNVGFGYEIAELTDYIPKTKNSSLIITTRDHLDDLEGIFLKFQAEAIQLPPLSALDGRKLLFQMINIKEETATKAQQKKADELVKQVDGLPLAITAICRRITDTHESLEKFRVPTQLSDPHLRSPYRDIVREIQTKGHSEAYNLIHILCFFESHIPVTMVRLGLKAISSEHIQVVGISGLDTALALLSRYALVELEMPDNEESSSDRDSPINPEYDVIRVHSVVQEFCIKELRQRTETATWLGHAIDLFCHSFRQAVTPTRLNCASASLADCLAYKTHGECLNRHIAQLVETPEGLEQKTSLQSQLEDTLAWIKREILALESVSLQENETSSAQAQISISDRREVPQNIGHIDKRLKPPPAFKKDTRVWMRNPATGLFNRLMYVVEPRYQTDIHRYSYRLRNHDGIEYGNDVSEGDLNKA